MMIDRVGNGLFGFLRAVAVVCGVAGVVTLFTASPELAWPWLRAALLCAAPVMAPVIFARLFEAAARRAARQVKRARGSRQR
jgi:hypothetical protein